MYTYMYLKTNICIYYTIYIPTSMCSCVYYTYVLMKPLITSWTIPQATEDATIACSLQIKQDLPGNQ